jgi:hypothetical protein
MEPDRVRFELEIERDRQPIEGCLTDERGTTTPFTGWLELMALLEKPQADPQLPPADSAPASSS